MRTLTSSNRSLALSAVVVVIAFCLPAAGFARPQAANAASTSSSKKDPARSSNPFCNRLAQSIDAPKGSIGASQGAQMFCHPPSSSSATAQGANASSGTLFGSNVDAANPNEDVSPSGVQVHGQSETSIASAGPYVVEAWNDGTGFIAGCPSPMNKEELTGFGFSSDGGKTFTDLGGLPNADCANSRIEGDPSVEAYTVGGSTYFYIGSIFIPFNVPENAMSLTACKVTPASGSTTATLSCGQPIVAAISSDCQSFYGFTFCSFLDKDFVSIDAGRGRLYMSYTEFGPSTGFSGVIELAACDLRKPMNPTCYNGSEGSIVGGGAAAAPYLVMAPADPNGCENEGAYPSVDAQTGDVYVAYENNWATNIFGCFNPFTGTFTTNEPTQNVMTHVSFSCLTLPTASCPGPDGTVSLPITSMAATFPPGYNRFPMNDFPRIAVSDPAGTVSMVWNDTRQHGTGDIFLQSFDLGSLTSVQSQPVRLNGRNDVGGWNFLPALRNADGQGNLAVSYYSRLSPNSALTDVYASLQVSPRTTSTPGKSIAITTGPTDWNAVSSIIIPNFGDYTDNYFAGSTLYVAWSDGRLGFPQPFENPLVLHKQ